MSKPTPPMDVAVALNLAAHTVRYPSRLTGDEFGRLVDDLTLYAQATAVLAAEVRRLHAHSVLLNQVAWRISEAAGNVPPGATAVAGDVLADLGELIQEMLELRVAALARKEPT